MITLGIVGVVAALTLPNLIADHRKKVLENQFKSMYSLIYQALILTKQDLGSDSLFMDYAEYSSELAIYPRAAEFKTAFYKRMKVVCNISLKMDDYSIYSDRRIKLYANNKDFSLAIPDKILSNGAIIRVEIGSSIAGRQISFTTDINGKKGPNRFGHDLFVFRIQDASDKLVGAKKIKDYTEDELGDLSSGGINNLMGLPCSKNSKQTANGVGCAWYAINDVCPDDASKRYWECLPK